MLAVRRIRNLSLYDATGVSNKEIPIRASQIIGPAVCVLLEGECDHENNLSIFPKLNDHLDREQQCVMQLV